MNPRIILYGLVGSLCTFMGLTYLLEKDYIWGVALLVIGVLNVFQMFRLTSEEDKRT